jgi:DNA polymerase V
LARRVNLTANHVLPEGEAPKEAPLQQLDLFTDYAALASQQQAEEADGAKERRMQEAMLSIKKKFGKNAILKGMNLQEGATTMERNRQIGGHKA